jgi:thioredoxin reductase
MQGYLSRDGMPPTELLAVGRAEVERYGVEVRAAHVASVAPGFEVSLQSGEVLSARRLLVATGGR